MEVSGQLSPMAESYTVTRWKGGKVGVQELPWVPRIRHKFSVPATVIKRYDEPLRYSHRVFSYTQYINPYPANVDKMASSYLC